MESTYLHIRTYEQIEQPLLNLCLPHPPPSTALPSAAVTCLAKFGAACNHLLESILVLLDRCMMDTDDEVRDRAIFYREVLKQKQASLNSAYILNGENRHLSGRDWVGPP